MAHFTSFPQTTRVYPIALALLLGWLASPAFANYSIQLTWDASPDAVQGYKVYMGTSPGSYPSLKDAGLNQSFVIQNLPDGKSYYFTVTAYDQMGNESIPSEEVAVTIPDSTPPSTPTNVTVASSSDSEVSIQWTASTDNVGVTGYKIARDNHVLGLSQTTYFIDSTVAPGTTYHYTVKAMDANGNTSAWSAPLQVTIPQALAQLTVSTNGNGEITSSPNGINCPKQSCTVNYPHGTVVTLTATPGNGSSFDGWTGSCTGTDLCSITLIEDMAVNANFSRGAGRGKGNGPNK